MAGKEFRKRAVDTASDHEELRERDKMVLEGEAGTKKPRKRSLRLWGPI